MLILKVLIILNLSRIRLNIGKQSYWWQKWDSKKWNTVPLKYLSNFWRSLGIPLINSKAQLKVKWTKFSVFASKYNDSTNNNSNNIVFDIKDTKLYVPVVTLSAKNNKELSKLLSRWFERSVYRNEYKVKMNIKYD